MLTVIENIKYLPGKKFGVYRVKHTYTDSEELKKVIARELFVKSEDVHIIKPLHGKFTKVQYVFIKENKIKLKTKKIKLKQGYCEFFDFVNDLSLESYDVFFENVNDFTQEEKVMFKFAINYFVDEYHYNFINLKELMKKDNDTPLKLSEVLFRIIIEEHFPRGKTSNLIFKIIKKRSFEDLKLIRNKKIKLATKAYMQQEYDLMLKHLPKNLVKKYVTFFFHKQWNKVLSNGIKKLIPERFLLEHKKSNLVFFLKSRMPNLNFPTTLSINLESNNAALNEVIVEEKARLNPFFEYFKEYYDNYERSIFVNYQQFNIKQNVLHYRIKPEDNIMIPKSFILIKNELINKDENY